MRTFRFACERCRPEGLHYCCIAADGRDGSDGDWNSRLFAGRRNSRSMKLGRRRPRVPAQAQHRQANRSAARTAAPRGSSTCRCRSRAPGPPGPYRGRCRCRRTACVGRVELDDRPDRQQLPDRRRRRRLWTATPAAVVSPLQYAVAVNASRAPGSGGGMTEVALAVPPAPRPASRASSPRRATRSHRRNRRHDRLPPERPSDDHALEIVDPWGRNRPVFEVVRSAISPAGLSVDDVL